MMNPSLLFLVPPTTSGAHRTMYWFMVSVRSSLLLRTLCHQSMWPCAFAARPKQRMPLKHVAQWPLPVGKQPRSSHFVQMGHFRLSFLPAWHFIHAKCIQTELWLKT
eukprot:5625881-Prorocentrum_lima.AAC.1